MLRPTDAGPPRNAGMNDVAPHAGDARRRDKPLGARASAVVSLVQIPC
jgi:hypothetical protein